MTLPKQIDCIEIVKYGGPENLIMTKRDTPQINKNELSTNSSLRLSKLRYNLKLSKKS